jgi:hypothetical protein
VRKITDNPMMQLAGIFASVGRAPAFNIAPKELNIRANPTGIEKGWFNFPINFDPLWLENCDGFTEKEEGK